MEILLIYFIKVSISLALFYGLYYMLLRNQTSFVMQRIYLISILLLSFVLPAITLPQFAGMTIVDTDFVWNLPVLEVNPDTSDGIYTTPIVALSTLLMSVWILVSLIMLVKLGIQIMSLARVLRSAPMHSYDGYRLMKIANNQIPTFSFGNWIVINVKDKTESQINDMLDHELVHVRQRHTNDVLICQLACILMWWNPFVWLIRRAVKLNLEYLADSGVQQHKEDMRDYQYLLLEISTANTGVAIINNFNVSQIKKRITMMNKKRTSLLSVAKYFLAIPLALVMIQCNSDTAEEAKGATDVVTVTTPNGNKVEMGDVSKQVSVKGESGIYTVSEQMPKYVGGDAELFKFIAENLKYPKSSQDAGVQGRVVIRFVVSKTGKVEDVTLVSGLDSACDIEAMRVVKSMPDWEPGKQDGQAVPVFFTVPIQYSLK